MRLKSTYIAVICALGTSACSPDSVLDPSDRPEPPPADALDADFSFFESRSPAPGGVTSSWTQALQTVAMAREDMALLVVSEALVRAATAGPGMRDGQQWRWPFSTTVDGAPYDGVLRSVISGGQYEWDLFVDAPDHDPPLAGYLWGKAFTPSRAYEGLWWFADDAVAGDSVIAQVSWIVNPDNGINFAFSASDSAGWRYERSLNATVLTWVVFDSPRRRVTWFHASGTGSSWTTATTTACWDEDLHDVVC